MRHFMPAGRKPGPRSGWAKEVWAENEETAGHGGLFGLGEPNTAFAPYFIGNSYLKMLTTSGVPIANVTFEPGCRNNWHIHHALSGGGQLLLCVDGQGWVQEWGKPARALNPGDVVVIPAGVKHWHGASAQTAMTHLAIAEAVNGSPVTWLEKVTDEQYPNG